MSERNSLDYLSQVQDLMDLYEFMEDDDLAEAMDLALKCIAKPNIPPAYAKEALLKMEALSFKFRMMGNTYMTIKKGTSGTVENKKKNVYFSVSEACHELAGALKYVARDL